jgi:hypothetical protein
MIMAKKFRRKHVIKLVTVGLYLLMVVTMVVGWSMRGF